MRVLLLNYEFPPAGGGGGFACYNIGREMVKLGIEVDILTSSIEGEEDGAVLHGMTVFRVPSWRKGIHDCGLLGAFSYVVFAFFKRLKLLRTNKYDIEHYFFSLPTGVLSLFSTQKMELPYIVSLRGSDVPGYDPFNSNLEKIHKLLIPITKKIWSNASRVVALSNDLKEIALQTSPDQNISIIPNGIEVDHFYPSQKDENHKGPLKLVTVSRLLERKGIHHLLLAIAKPEPLPIILEIAGTGSYEDELKKLCAELNLNDRVTFTGFVRRDELPEIYRNGDVFTLPSQTESFGLVFAEAMSCGLPIIATFVGGIPELVRNELDGLLIKPGAPEEIRSAIEYMINNPEKRKSMGVEARQRIEDKYAWRVIASQYFDYYKE